MGHWIGYIEYEIDNRSSYLWDWERAPQTPSLPTRTEIQTLYGCDSLNGREVAMAITGETCWKSVLCAGESWWWGDVSLRHFFTKLPKRLAREGYRLRGTAEAASPVGARCWRNCIHCRSLVPEEPWAEALRAAGTYPRTPESESKTLFLLLFLHHTLLKPQCQLGWENYLKGPDPFFRVVKKSCFETKRPCINKHTYVKWVRNVNLSPHNHLLLIKQMIKHPRVLFLSLFELLLL